ncbi:hypothetical protein CC80DRAFT_532308 [Byssothecium circinans]|uniref:Uncharacterized protein n=1 Tax=Byssothecium circinans TaxID=147558 RepID=A0A6A5U711_9PLEO|nr:hypothetical protein CC80DRAFT_532308 [Byssothecium circinans]
MARNNDLGKLMSAGGAAAAIGGAYKIGEFLFHAKKLRDVGPSNAVYVRLIARVRTDLDEVRRLLSVREVHDALEANKEKAKWVYGAVRDVRGALENITPHTERVGSDIDAGRRVGIRHRVYWLMSEKEKLENREKELVVAHSSLMEVIGYLTGLEPEASKHKHKEEKHHHEEKRDKVDRHVDVDIDVRHEGPERVDRDVHIERDGRGPRRVVTERETYVEHETERRGPRYVDERHIEHEHRGPRRVEEHYIEHEHRGPGHYDERETWVDESGRPRRYDEREVFVDHHGPRHQDGRYVDERELHVERDPRDPRHVEARYSERGPTHYEEKRYEERRFPEPLGRRPESFEDRLPERDTWMQSDARRPGGRGGEYAEYGAPQPVGAAHYRRKFEGDPGFGDEEVLNPQIVAPSREHQEREMWIEEKEDYRYDEYGNRLPDRYFPNAQRRSRL